LGVWVLGHNPQPPIPNPPIPKNYSIIKKIYFEKNIY